MNASITIVIDTDCLRHYEDMYLAQLWHVAQANPVPDDDLDAAHLVELIGKEIIRRWLKATPASLWEHQVGVFERKEIRRLREGGAA